jgi:hypothetical protein
MGTGNCRKSKKLFSVTHVDNETSSDSEASCDDPPAKVVSDDFIVFGSSEEAHSEAAVQDTTKR